VDAALDFISVVPILLPEGIEFPLLPRISSARCQEPLFVIEFREATLPSVTMATYEDHISEVFIKPIRSVLAIDDRFPTLQLFLSGDVPHTRDEIDRLAKLLAFCREKNPEWLVDVDDGRGD